MTTKTDIRQLISRDTLSRITNAAGSQLDLIIRDLDNEITPPLALSASSTPNLVLNIGNIALANPTTSLNRTIPPISNLLPSFSSGTVTLGSTGAGSATPSVGTALALGMTASQFLKIGVCIDATGSLTLTKGTAGASLAAATTPPSVSGLFAIGYFVARTNGSNNVQNILTSDIYQYVGGGGGGSSSGTGNPILETLKNQAVDGPYALFTPNIIAVDAQTKISTLTGASYDLVTNAIKFTANAQVLTSTTNIDQAEMTALGWTDITSLDLDVFWNPGTSLQAFSVPTAFTYQVSRDQGSTYYTMTMGRVGATNTFRGSLTFDNTETPAAIHTQPTQDANRVLNATTQQALSQPFTVTVGEVVNNITLSLAKAGSPSGNFYVSIVADNAGNPSTTTVYCNSAAQAISGVATGPANVTITLPTTVLAPGTYHWVISTDSTYQASFVSTTTELRVREQQSGPSTPYTRALNAGTWAIATTNSNLTYTINGRIIDVRVKITSAGSPTYPCGLDGYAVFYARQDYGITGASKKTQRFVFDSVADNSNAFTLNFSPDPDLLTCKGSPMGQIWTSADFQLAGNTVTFPANFFNNGGLSQTVTLTFDQNTGGAFDNSDSNARLMSTNHLGSSSGADDRSANGRGPILRDSSGTLREIGLNTLGYPIVLASPGGSTLRDITTPSTLDDAAATRLGQKVYLPGTNYNGGNSFTIAGGAGFSLTRGVFLPYQTQDGNWRIRFSIAYTQTSSTTADLTITGISFNTVLAALSAVGNSTFQPYVGKYPGSGSVLTIRAVTTAETSWAVSGDLELLSKPAFAY